MHLSSHLSSVEMRKLWLQMAIDSEKQKNFNKMIRDSWKRSYNHNVNPFMKRNHTILDQEQLNQKIERNQDLLTVAIPIVKSIFEFIKGSNFVVALADNEGVLLYVQGDEKSLEFTQKANFVEGAKWSEDIMGTNAVGLALVEKKPVQVYGYEHFCICAYNSTCSAAPIKDTDGKVIGVLDITGPFEKVHHHTLGMAVAGVNAIEKQLILKKALHENILAQQYKSFIMDSISEGIFTTDNSGYITHINNPAASILQIEPQKAIGQNLAKLLGDNENNFYFINLVRSNKTAAYVPVNIIRNMHKVKCTVCCTQLSDSSGKNIGRVVILQEYKTINKLVNKINGFNAKVSFKDIIGEDECFKNAIRLARAAANSDCNVLILGESGTGKEMFAQAIHNASIRAKQPFIAINCAAIPKDLIASELFGYDEGAFTGARKGGNPGKFELADQGTIFLDEIGEMPLDLQATLLRVLEEKLIMRIGGNEYLPVNIRIIAATNKELLTEIEKKHFRRDLYYRLNTMIIRIPPLRGRKNDIKTLAFYFLNKTSKRLGKNIYSISDEILDLFYKYTWPGNIRELQNVIEHMVNLSSDTPIIKDLPDELLELPANNSSNSFSDSINNSRSSIRDIEEQTIREYLARYVKKNKVAKKLGISRSTLYRKIKEYGIEH